MAKTIPCQQKSGIRDLFKTNKKFAGMFLILFFFAGTKWIFKPDFYFICCLCRFLISIKKNGETMILVPIT